MIESIQGKLRFKDPTSMVVEVGGVCFRVSIPVSTFDRLPDIGKPVSVLTFLNVREDALELYGFFEEDERDLFKLLIGVNKIGPKLAIGILSGASPIEFKRRIIAGDVGALMALPGIGAKMARRIIVELKEKFVSTDMEELLGVGETLPDEFSDALVALTSLGIGRADAFRTLSEMKRNGEFEGDLEEIIKTALSKS